MHDVKNTCNYQELPLRRTHWTLCLTEEIYNDYNNVLLFWNFYISRLQERRLPILKFSQENSQKKFLNFLTSNNIFITLQYSGDILGIFLKQAFLECYSNILETSLRDYWNLPKDQHFLLSNHTLLTEKQPFHR